MIGAHPIQFAKNNAQKDTYSANIKTSTPMDARSNLVAKLKEKIQMGTTAQDSARQSVFLVKFLPKVESPMTDAQSHLIA